MALDDVNQALGRGHKTMEGGVDELNLDEGLGWQKSEDLRRVGE